MAAAIEPEDRSSLTDPYPTEPAFLYPRGALMFSLLSRGSAAASALLRTLHRAAAVVMTIAMITGTAAIGMTIASTAGDDVERFFGGRSDVKLIRDFQLPTL